ncbi:MAG TPA: ABC transporter ATP-binding protein [Steroidobacteraceae bacterium]|jgi:putative ABC transport system ATP-binding protein|nr:ABC transporter ATP-binding protein [Steroidobacteraceae bacterium]
MLRLQAISKRFRAEGAPVLDRLELTLEPGEYLAIMGESGAGKSTLLNVIAGLDRPDSGSVLFDGTELAALDDDAITRWRRAHMGFVFQAFHVLPYLRVEQNVALPLELLDVSDPQRREAVRQMLAACGIEALSERYPRELSGGELQRIAIARALVHRPQLLLADEPTGNLDARTADQILRLLRAQLQATHAGAILITHSMTAARSADRILKLEGGQLQPLA